MSIRQARIAATRSVLISSSVCQYSSCHAYVEYCFEKATLLFEKGGRVGSHWRSAQESIRSVHDDEKAVPHDVGKVKLLLLGLNDTLATIKVVHSAQAATGKASRTR